MEDKREAALEGSVKEQQCNKNKRYGYKVKRIKDKRLCIDTIDVIYISKDKGSSS